ncbi:MAG: hypothetical protein PHV32_07490, partial [Eubacteriales bacterium]|nr:hypothetical protein [Eubacteriales bacterium]
MLSKDELDDFNKRMADKISYSMQRSLTEKGSIPANTGKNVLKDYIYRMLQYYSGISSYDIGGT